MNGKKEKERRARQFNNREARLERKYYTANRELFSNGQFDEVIEMELASSGYYYEEGL